MLDTWIGFPSCTPPPGTSRRGTLYGIALGIYRGVRSRIRKRCTRVSHSFEGMGVKEKEDDAFVPRIRTRLAFSSIRGL